MTFEVRNNGIRHQQKWQGIFPHKPFLLKNDHFYGIIILVTKFDAHLSRYKILHSLYFL